MKIAIMLSLFSLFSIVAVAQDGDSCTLSVQQKAEAKKIAGIWLEEIFKAVDIDKLMKISDVPFAFDRVSIITDTNELRKNYLQIFENKKPRAVPQYNIDFLKCTSEIMDDCIPVSGVLFLINIGSGNEKTKGLVVSLQLRNGTFKVTGLSD